MPGRKLHLGRWLLKTAGVAAPLLAAAAVALWVRSHWATDWVYVQRGSVTATIMTARNGCLFQWTGGRAERLPFRGNRYSSGPSDMIRGNWRFWTQSEPRRLLGVITWGRTSYGINGASGWGMSILLPYWLLACGAAATGTGLLMISRLLHRRARGAPGSASAAATTSARRPTAVLNAERFRNRHRLPARAAVDGIDPLVGEFPRRHAMGDDGLG